MAVIGEEEGQQLHLTDLPDDILIRILSLLPTETAVWTCLLLLRRSGQHHLWKSLTSLEFHQGYMFTRNKDFKNFVDSVIDLRDHSVPLLSFSLQYFRVRALIANAVQCNVLELTLSICDMGTWNTTKAVQCQYLIKLDLESITFNVSSSDICLPHLKFLRLCDVKFEPGELKEEKLLTFSLLEELIIDRCSWGINSIRVCSPKLRVLKIYDLYYRLIDVIPNICIFGDNLQYFYYVGDLLKKYRICASSSMQLSKVEIYVNKKMRQFAAPNCYKILKGLSETRNLALSDHFLEELQDSSELLNTVPVFECLTRLNIRVYKKMICMDSLALMKIYERCPHLEYLNIGKLSHAVKSQQLSPIPLCFRIHLKKILVHYYVPGDEDDDAIDVLLKSAFVLEELVIYCKMDEEIGFQKLQDRLNRRPRVSKNCTISVRTTYDIERSKSLAVDHYGNCYLNSMSES